MESEDDFTFTSSNGKIKSYSQTGQDVFVSSLFNKGYIGFFIDIGCNRPKRDNNTLLLEENGWDGLAIDIVDFKAEWKIRRTPFIMEDALKCNYDKIFEQFNVPNIIDYLSLDVEGEGDRYRVLKRIIESGHEFKVITAEHDSYRGYNQIEKMPQRKLLKDHNYFLLCSDVMIGNNPYEDWWINPKYFDESRYMFYNCSNTEYSEILKKCSTNKG